MKLIAAVVMGCLFASSAMAGGWHGRHNGQFERRSNDWIAPLVVGGIVGYAFSRPTYSPPPPVTYVESRRCDRVIFVDSYGNYIREEQRCN